MEAYFNIRYEMDKEAVWQSIDRFISEQAPTYICVADGVILNIANRNPEYLKVGTVVKRIKLYNELIANVI